MKEIGLGLAMGETACSLYGKSMYDYYHDPKVATEVEVSVFEEFGADGITMRLGLRGLAEAFGTKIGYKENAISYVEKPVVQEIGDIAKLKIPNPATDGKMPIVIEALDLLQAEIGDRVGVTVSIAAPYSVALNICGAENLLKWTIRHPQELKELLEIITEANNRFIDEASKTGVAATIVDPVSSTTLVSHKQYREFSYPYFKKNVDYIIEVIGKSPSLHVCGTSKALWNDIADSGVSAFSLDNVEDIGELKEAVGDRIRIVGNVPPVDVIAQGSFADIDRSLKECILKAWDSPMGYTIEAGCQIPYGTPRENLRYYVDRARELSRYPLDFDLLNS